MKAQFMDNFRELDKFSYFLLIFLMIIGIAIVNFINFMDGIDGLIAGSMILIFLLGSIFISNSFLIFVGSLLAFLLWNWSPSKVFMGDGGSTFLGSLFFRLLLDSSSLFELVKIFIVSSPLLMDAFTCVIRRFINNQKIFRSSFFSFISKVIPIRMESFFSSNPLHHMHTNFKYKYDYWKLCINGLFIINSIFDWVVP